MSSESSPAAVTSARHRLDVASRLVAAVFGGYALAAAATLCFSLHLPLPRAEAVQTASMLSFAVHMGAILWAFGATTARHAWTGIILPTAALAAVALAGASGP